MKRPPPPEDDLLPGFCYTVLACIVIFFIARNLPWHLDDLDQAKQAFVSHEIVQTGNWLYQHTPTGGVATKPPLAGWISTAIYLMAGGNGWEIAWRLPSFVCALLLLRALWRTGGDLFGNNIGSMLAAGMFGLNFFTPRLATLVRTDMLLATFIFFAGWMVLEKIRSDEEWTRRELTIVGLCVLGALMTKGPIGYAFLAPGMLTFWYFSRRFGLQHPGFGGKIGAVAWLAPLLIFAFWAVIGLASSAEFKEQVVMKEFFGRFTVGENAQHNNQWPGYYTLNLLVKTIPWTVLLGLFLLEKRVRAALREDPALLWLACWTAGGLLFMELVPSKRFDRIFPVVAPACLLLAACARYLPKFEWKRQPIAQLAILSALLGVVLAGGYAGWKVAKHFREDARLLVRFGNQVREIVGDQHDRLAVINGKDEGMLLYTGTGAFTSMEDARRMWKFRRIEWILLGKRAFLEHKDELAPFEIVLQTPEAPEKSSSYRFIKRIPPAAKLEFPPAVEALPPPLPPTPAPGSPEWQPPATLEQ